MSSLTLVRHAQASFHADDYDNLSDHGIAQATALGAALADREFDSFYVGPQRRHRQTLDHMASGGLAVQEPAVVEDLSEIDTTSLGEEALARVSPSCPDLKAQVGRGTLDDAGREAFRHYLGVFEALMKRWTRGELGGRIDPYDGFAHQVMRGMQSIMKTEGRSRRVLVVSSGGPLSIVARHALGVSPEMGIELMFALRNASITELRYTQDRLSLLRFNDVGALRPDMITGI